MNKMKKTIGEKIFDTCNFILMLLIIFVSLYPLWYVLVASFSKGIHVTNGKVIWWIKEFTWDAYKTMFNDGKIFVAYGNTIFYSIVGTAVNLILTALGAYALSKQRLRGRSMINKIILLSMWFSAGMIPTYI